MRCVFAAAVLALIAVAGATAADLVWDSSQYTGGHLNVMTGFDFHWAPVDTSLPAAEQVFNFTLVVPFITQGWVGFGVGEPYSGSMPGADMMILRFDTATMQEPEVGDYFAEGFTTPKLDCDEGKNEWNLLRFTTNGSTAAFEFSRAVKVQSSLYDRDIGLGINGAKLLFAYSDTTATLANHGAKRALASPRLMPPSSGGVTLRNLDDLKAQVVAGSVQVAQWKMANYNVPAAVTTYADTPCFQPPGNNASGFAPQILAIEATREMANKQYIHHIVAKGFANSNCAGNGATDSVQFIALAGTYMPFMLPEGVGFAMGTYNSYLLEIHYDNPSLTAGVVDNTGVNVYYSFELVTHAAGMMQIGDPWLQTGTGLTAIPTGLSSYHYVCPATCRTDWTADEVFVISEFFHMHQIGFKMNFTLVGNDGTVKRQMRSDFYQFAIQQNEYTEPWAIKKTDRLEVTCSYKNSGSSAVSFGQASNQEMCIDFIMYYPVQTASHSGAVCGKGACATTTFDMHTVESVSNFPTSFGEPTCSSSGIALVAPAQGLLPTPAATQLMSSSAPTTTTAPSTTSTTTSVASTLATSSAGSVVATFSASQQDTGSALSGSGASGYSTLITTTLTFVLICLPFASV